MNNIQFTWDDQKDRENQKKHGVSFEEAKSVFYDENARLIHDPDHSDAEERFILLGLSYKLRIILVVHCYYEDESIIRIIAAKKAVKNEQRKYKEFLK